MYMNFCIYILTIYIYILIDNISKKCIYNIIYIIYNI